MGRFSKSIPENRKFTLPKVRHINKEFATRTITPNKIEKANSQFGENIYKNDGRTYNIIVYQCPFVLVTKANTDIPIQKRIYRCIVHDKDKQRKSYLIDVVIGNGKRNHNRVNRICMLALKTEEDLKYQQKYFSLSASNKIVKDNSLMQSVMEKLMEK